MTSRRVKNRTYDTRRSRGAWLLFTCYILSNTVHYNYSYLTQSSRSFLCFIFHKKTLTDFKQRNLTILFTKLILWPLLISVKFFSLIFEEFNQFPVISLGINKFLAIYHKWSHFRYTVKIRTTNYRREQNFSLYTLGNLIPYLMRKFNIIPEEIGI